MHSWFEDSKLGLEVLKDKWNGPIMFYPEIHLFDTSTGGAIITATEDEFAENCSNLIDNRIKIINISNPGGRERFYTVVGYICETDTFGSNRKISEISEGDFIAFKNAGAYCFTMSSNYNSRYRPAEVIWHNSEPHLIRKQETFEDLLKNQILIDLKKGVMA